MLSLIQQVLERGEQATVFGAFNDSLDVISARLREAGIRHLVLDGRTSQSKRGQLTCQFKLNSPWPVNVWSVICEGSIDRRLEANLHEKNDASELVLDGHLLGESPAEMNLAELLEIARKEFDGGRTARCIDEVELEKGWPRLRATLGKAFIQWRKDITPIYLPSSQPSHPTSTHYHDLF